MNDQTSLITLLSSDHGRLRREQRDISKRDLQKAVKHGAIESAWGQRYKITYDGIVFITDSTMRREVTCFPAPMDLAPVDDKTYQDHKKALQIIAKKPEHCASHTVLVVDTSGSMKTHDILLHRDRQVAAFTMVALEYVAEQLFKETANNRDVLSLIEFNRTATVIFTREPVSWVLFNKLLKRRDIDQKYRSREQSKVSDVLCSDSNYLPALDTAEKLLELDFRDDCALSLFFISDGLPTDAGANGLTPAGAMRRMNERMSQIASRFVDQLNISLVGFGSSYLDFSSLEKMAKAANKAAGVDIAKFCYCDKLAHSIGNAVSSLASSTMLTKTALASGAGRLTMTKNNLDEATRLFQQRQFPPFLAMNKGYLDTGVERVAYRCHLADDSNTNSFRLGAMVGKETLRTDRIIELIAFHKSFCETQSLAAHLADQFNNRLRGLPYYCKDTTPRLSFLECSVLILDDPKWPRGERGVLVEKQLDTDRFPWTKWNNNGGGVDGQIRHRPMDVDFELEQLERETLEGNTDMMIIEEDSEEEEDTDDESEEGIEDDTPETMKKDGASDPYSPSDYLQAFSHFTYLFTNKKLVVVDLQGIFNEDTRTFELSDPAIHYRSSQGSSKRMVYGRTDKGQAGVQLFFNSHVCTGICKILELSQKKTQWKKHWRRNFDEDMRNNFSV